MLSSLIQSGTCYQADTWGDIVFDRDYVFILYHTQNISWADSLGHITFDRD